MRKIPILIVMLAVIFSASEVIGEPDPAGCVQITINCSNCTIILPENCNISISGEGGNPCQISMESGKVHIECATPGAVYPGGIRG